MLHFRWQLRLVLSLAILPFSGGLTAQDATQDSTQDGVQSVQSVGDNFRLFEEIDSNAATNNQSRSSRVTRENRNTPSSPEFTLVGTSRIGSNYQAILLNRNGESVVVNTSPNANTRIPGFSDYSVVDISAGRVSVRFPGNNPCVEYLDKGVSCNSAANIAALGLATGEPIAPSRADSNHNLAADAETSEDLTENTPVNPFEALRASQENNAAATSEANRNNGRFRPRRIDPDNVPQGMRVISTPFGDRLVEQ